MVVSAFGSSNHSTFPSVETSSSHRRARTRFPWNTKYLSFSRKVRPFTNLLRSILIANVSGRLSNAAKDQSACKNGNMRVSAISGRHVVILAAVIYFTLRTLAVPSRLRVGMTLVLI
jgi:hypothetical protein